MATFSQVPKEPSIKLFDRSTHLGLDKKFNDCGKHSMPEQLTTSLDHPCTSDHNLSSTHKIRTFGELVDKLTSPTSQDQETIIKPLPFKSAVKQSTSFILTTSSRNPSISSRDSSSSSSENESVIRKAKIRSIEELLDSSSDLDLPSTPPPPPVSAKLPSEKQKLTFPINITQPPEISPVILESISVSLKIPPNLVAPPTSLPSSSAPAVPPFTTTFDPKELTAQYQYKMSIETIENGGSHNSTAISEELKSLHESSSATLETIIVPGTPRKQLDATNVDASTGMTTNNRMNAASPTPTTVSSGNSGGISVNHYERLIEELKCPGCASPMKAPIKLCATGHSVCEHCTTVLMLCPLCKEPFTNVRSLTLEALCSKALFRCSNAAAGCAVRLQQDLLSWHEKQCIWKPMKCFMGRVWGHCSWAGREAGWKDHLERQHADKVFKSNQVNLKWNLDGKIKSLAGYYVFEVYDEMFNFYQIYDRDRILFTMTITTMVRERKHNFAYEVELFHKDNEALSITQRFPVHSEYDPDILLDGTCVSVQLADLSRLIGQEKIINFRVRIHEVKSPKSYRTAPLKPSRKLPLDFKQTNIEGANLKCVPPSHILTRQIESILSDGPKSYGDKDEKDASSADEDLEGCEFATEKKWGTPQLHFNRKYLCDTSSSSSSAASAEAAASNSQRNSLCEISGSKNKMKNVTSNLRRSIRSLKTDIIDLKKPFITRSTDKRETLLKK